MKPSSCRSFENFFFVVVCIKLVKSINRRAFSKSFSCVSFSQSSALVLSKNKYRTKWICTYKIEYLIGKFKKKRSNLHKVKKKVVVKKKSKLVKCKQCVLVCWYCTVCFVSRSFVFCLFFSFCLREFTAEKASDCQKF